MINRHNYVDTHPLVRSVAQHPTLSCSFTPLADDYFRYQSTTPEGSVANGTKEALLKFRYDTSSLSQQQQQHHHHVSVTEQLLCTMRIDEVEEDLSFLLTLPFPNNHHNNDKQKKKKKKKEKRAAAAKRDPMSLLLGEDQSDFEPLPDIVFLQEIATLSGSASSPATNNTSIDDGAQHAVTSPSSTQASTTALRNYSWLFEQQQQQTPSSSSFGGGLAKTDTATFCEASTEQHLPKWDPRDENRLISLLQWIKHAYISHKEKLLTTALPNERWQFEYASFLQGLTECRGSVADTVAKATAAATGVCVPSASSSSSDVARSNYQGSIHGDFCTSGASQHVQHASYKAIEQNEQRTVVTVTVPLFATREQSQKLFDTLSDVAFLMKKFFPSFSNKTASSSSLTMFKDAIKLHGAPFVYVVTLSLSHNLGYSNASTSSSSSYMVLSEAVEVQWHWLVDPLLELCQLSDSDLPKMAPAGESFIDLVPRIEDAVVDGCVKPTYRWLQLMDEVSCRLEGQLPAKQRMWAPMLTAADARPQSPSSTSSAPPSSASSLSSGQGMKRQHAAFFAVTDELTSITVYLHICQVIPAHHLLHPEQHLMPTVSATSAHHGVSSFTAPPSGASSSSSSHQHHHAAPDSIEVPLQRYMSDTLVRSFYADAGRTSPSPSSSSSSDLLKIREFAGAIESFLGDFVKQLYLRDQGE